jgi:hypothetical protein
MEVTADEPAMNQSQILTMVARISVFVNDNDEIVIDLL